MAKIWIKVDLFAGDNQIYVYYGNENAPDYSNGDEVFEFFDDFNGNELDTNKWDVGVDWFFSYLSVSNGYLYMSGYAEEFEYIESKNKKFSPPVVLEILLKDDSVLDGSCNFGFGYRNANNSPEAPSNNSVLRCATNYSYYSLLTSDGSGTDNECIDGSEPTDDFFHKFKIVWNNNKCELYKDDTLKFVTTCHIPSSEENVRIGYPESSYDAYSWAATIDYIFVRKYTDPEPTVTYGAEETGNWEKNGHTYTKRKKVTINSTQNLTDYQVALDYAQFNTSKLYIEYTQE